MDHSDFETKIAHSAVKAHGMMDALVGYRQGSHHPKEPVEEPNHTS